MSWQRLQIVRWTAYLAGLLLLIIAAEVRNVAAAGAVIVIIFIVDLFIVARWNLVNAEERSAPPARIFWIRIVALVLAVAAGVGCVFLSATKWGSIGCALFGIGIAFFAVGQIVGEVRHMNYRRNWRGFVFFVVAAALLYVAGYLLANRWTALGLVVAGCTVFATQLALSTGTRDVRQLFPRDLKMTRALALKIGIVAASGAGLVGAGAWLLSWQGASGGYLTVFIPVVIILVAMVSARANSDVILVVVFVAVLLSRAPSDAHQPSVMNLSDGQSVIVAMGDSYISGEGAKHFLKGTDNENGNACRRADTAWPVGLAASGGVPGHASHEGLVFVACSGAKANQVLHGGQPQYSGEPLGSKNGMTQLDQVDKIVSSRDLHVDAVFLSIGGNDAQFSTVGKTCLGPGTCTELGSSWLSYLSDHVWQQLIGVYRQVRSDFKNTPVVVVPYPIPISHSAPGDQSCPGSPFSQGERDFLNDYTKTIDRLEARAAAHTGLLFMSTMQNAFSDGSWICGTSSKKAVNLFDFTKVNGQPDQIANPGRWVHGSFHPNEFGHAKMLAAAQAWLDAQPKPMVMPSPQAELSKPDVPTIGDLIGDQSYQTCDSTDKSGHSAGQSACNVGPKTWLLVSAGRMITRMGLALILTILGGWLLFLALKLLLERLMSYRAPPGASPSPDEDNTSAATDDASPEASTGIAGEPDLSQ